eukprot:m.90274 g.90274  ORF g.90274 m.90274 type:complete len:93 (+) comp21574_c0_seq10:52-330(+)
MKTEIAVLKAQLCAAKKQCISPTAVPATPPANPTISSISGSSSTQLPTSNLRNSLSAAVTPQRDARTSNSNFSGSPALSRNFASFLTALNSL